MNRLTKEQACVITAYTGVICVDFTTFHKYCEELLCRPILTHEFPRLADEIKKRSTESFMALCAQGT